MSAVASPVTSVCSPSYRARSPQGTALHAIVLDHHERFGSVYDEQFAARYGPWRRAVEDTFVRYLECGNYANGCLRVACTNRDCGYDVFVPFSCKCAICPSCAQRRSIEFGDFVDAEILEDVPYRHVVFTIPKILRTAVLQDRTLLLDLSHCAWRTLVRGLRVALGDKKAVPGAVLSRATAGDLGNGHPHLHSIVSCGAWSDGGRGSFSLWPAHLRSEDLEQLFRRKVLSLLVRRGRLAPSTAERLMQWNPTGFSVWLGDPIHPYEVESRQRLARYICKSPIALHRMSYDAATCQVTYTSVSQGRSRTVSALDFMADLSVHVPNPREHGVSYLGRCSNRSRGARRRADEDPAARGAPAPSVSRKAFRRSWAQLLKRVWQIDVTLCPRCASELKILSAVVNSKSCHRLIDHLGLPRARAPNPHECLPMPGAQLRLPFTLIRPQDAPLAVVAVQPEDERDPLVNDDWPSDAPFSDD